jgi:hypothetical protein
MPDASSSGRPAGTGATAREFFVFQELLNSPTLARFYTDLLINSPATVTGVRDRQGFSKSTAYKHANTLAELGVAEELDTYDNGSALWQAEAVSGVWTGDEPIGLGPTLTAVFGATGVNEDLELFVERHGRAAIAPAIMATVAYLEGETTRRGVADNIDVPAVEGIAVTQAIEPIIVRLIDFDPTLSDVTINVDVPSEVIEKCPYQLVGG